MKRIVGVFSVWLVLVLSAHAASFDCAKARTKVEHLICGNAELSKLDDELAAKYKTALKDKAKSDAVRVTQRQWLKERNKCTTSNCLQNSYRERIKEFSADFDIAGQKKLQIAPQKGALGTACLKPKIDWRNYEWTLISGSGQPPCDEMLAYLKSRPTNEPPPICPGERLPKNGNWTKPEVRVISEKERQAILKNIPDQWRQKPNGPFSYERQIEVSKKLRVIRGDITRDGIPEYFLALGGSADCERSKRCARPENSGRDVQLISDSYDLLPMNADGTQVDWSKVHSAPMLMRGELVYYKGLPYWLSAVFWDQSLQDDFAHSRMRPGDPYSAMFTLDRVSTYSATNPESKAFKDVTNVSPQILDPEDRKVCRIGYFRRENLKQHSARKGK